MKKIFTQEEARKLSEKDKHCYCEMCWYSQGNSECEKCALKSMEMFG